MELEDFKKEVAGWFTQKVADAIIKVNGTCFCKQCEEKCMALLEAMKECQEAEAQRAYENGAH